MNDINWSQERVVVTDGDDDYVVLEDGLMLASDYVGEGGHVEDARSFEREVCEVGRFTNVELQALYG